MDDCSYRDVVLNAPFAYACHKINFDCNGAVIDTSITSANERFAGLCKVSPEAIVGQQLAKLLPGLENISQNWPQLMAGIASNGNSSEYFIQLPETGKWFNIQLYSPGSNLCVTLFHAIELPRTSSEQLPEDGKRFQTLFDTMNQGVVYQNANGVITSANPAAERILGLTLDQLQGRTSIDPRWNSIHEDGTDYPGHDHPISNALKTGKADMGRVMGIYNPATDDTRWIVVDGIPDFRDGETTPYQAHAIFTDITERIQAEKTFKESERKITTLINNLNGLVYRCRNDRDWTMEFLSDGINQLTGYVKNDFIENKVRSYNSIIHKDDQQYLWDTIQKAVKKNEHFQLEYRVIHADGSIKWVLENGCGIFEGGQLVALEGFITDISEMKMSDRALAESEEKFRAAFYMSPEVITITRLSDGLYINVNDAFINTIGYTREEIIGNTASNLNIWVFPEHRKQLQQTLAEQGYILNLETVFRSKDGTHISALMSASLLDINGEKHLLAITRDVTEKKKVQEQISSLLERIDLATKSAGQGIWDWDISNNILLWDKQMHHLYAIPESDPGNTFQAWLKCIHPDDLTKTKLALENALDGSAPYDTSFRTILPDGSIRYLKAMGNVFRDESGKAIRMIGVNYDITQQKQNEKALHESEERYRTVVTASTEGIILQSKEREILTWNDGAEKITGTKASQAIGYKESISSFNKVYSEEGKQLTEAEDPSLYTLETGLPVRDMLLKIVQKNGNSFWIKLNTAPVFTDNSAKPGFVVISFADITSLKNTEEALKISETRVRKKLNAILEPDGDIGQLELADVLDIAGIQELMNNFYHITKVGIGIIDLNGNVLIGTGWQNICTDFHRKNPVACQHCIESDIELSKGAEPGKFKLYKCRNNMWDMVTPIMLANRHVGNIFLGQFLFEDEEPDLNLFKKQASLFGFDENKYLDALNKVPRWSHETVSAVMNFYTHFAGMVSTLSYSNIRLAQTLEENNKAREALLASAEVAKSIPTGLFIYRFEAPGKLYLVDANPAALKLTGYEARDILGKEFNEVWTEAKKIKLTDNYLEVMHTSIPYIANSINYAEKQEQGAFRITAFRMPDNKLGVAFEDVTELINAESKLIKAKETAEENEALLRAIIDNAPFDIWARDKNQTGILENKLTNEHFGLSILGRKPDYTGVPKEIAKRWKSNNLRVLNGEILNEECEYDIKGNIRIFQQVIAPILTSTGIDGIVGFNIDITDNKKAQLAIDNERKTLRTLIETIPDHVFMKDLEGRYITCNSKFAGFAGISVKEVEGKTDYEIFSKEQADSFRYHDKVALDSYKPVMNLESVVYKSDGHVEILETYKAPAFDANGQLIGIIGFSHDITAVHAAQEALKEREEIYSSIVNQANNSIALIDFETGRFVEFNHSAYQSLGFTQEEFSRLSIIDIEAEQSDADIKANLARIKENNSHTFETRHLHKSGKILDVRSSARIVNIRDRDYISAIWSDITEQKKIQANMIEKDLIFQSLMDNSPIYIFFKDHNIKSLFLSKNFEQMLGKPLQELIGKDMNELFPSELALNMIKDDQKILNQRELVVVDEDFNGHYYTTIKFPIIRENKPPLLAGFTIDITDRQLAQNALRQSERTLKQAQQIANMGSFEYDIENDTSFWSENLCRIYDIDPAKTLSSVLKKVIPEIVLPEDVAYTVKMFNDALQGLCPYDLEYRIKRKDGAIRYIHSRADYERDETGKPLRMIGLVQDITERRIAEEEIRMLNETLEKRVDERTLALQAVNRELEAFAYTVSHDLRAPLRAINGFTNILKEDFSNLLNADGLKLIEIITDNAARMGILIDDLLTFSRLSRSEMNLIEVDMNHLVKLVFQELTSPEQRAGISFNTKKLPAVFVDNSLIKQVWMNLISNAIKFSSKTEKPEITISAKKEADKVIFKITDNGVGFNMKYAGKLFGVFQRLHSVREFEGTGAGLAIVQRIIVRHGGKVWATSTLGKGADFYFSLPAKFSVI